MANRRNQREPSTRQSSVANNAEESSAYLILFSVAVLVLFSILVNSFVVPSVGDAFNKKSSYDTARIFDIKNDYDEVKFFSEKRNDITPLGKALSNIMFKF